MATQLPVAVRSLSIGTDSAVTIRGADRNTA